MKNLNKILKEHSILADGWKLTAEWDHTARLDREMPWQIMRINERDCTIRVFDGRTGKELSCTHIFIPLF